MNVNNVPKFVGLITAMICVSVLMGFNSISSDAGVALLSAIIGYLVGNGIAAKRSQPVEPVIGNSGTTTSGSSSSTF